MRRFLLVGAALLASAAPVRAGDAGPPEEDAGASAPQGEDRTPLVPTSRIEDLSVERVVAVLERKGDRMEIVETVTLLAREGRKLVPRTPLQLELPAGAVAPKIEGGGGEPAGIEARASGFSVRGPIGPDGEDFTISFEVPIEGGRATFEQRFPAAIGELQVICTWTSGAARLRVEGCRDGRRSELQGGLTALVAMTPALGGDTLAVAVTGVEDGGGRILRRIALALCVALAVVGVLAAFGARRRGARRGSP